MDRFGNDLEAVVGAHSRNLFLHLLLFETSTLLVVKLINMTLLVINLFDGFLYLCFGISLGFDNLLMFLMGFGTGCSSRRSSILDWLLLFFGFLLFFGGRFFFGFFLWFFLSGRLFFGFFLWFFGFLLFLSGRWFWFSGWFIFFFLFFLWSGISLLLSRLFGLLLS